MFQQGLAADLSAAAADRAAALHWYEIAASRHAECGSEWHQQLLAPAHRGLPRRPPLTGINTSLCSAAGCTNLSNTALVMPRAQARQTRPWFGARELWGALRARPRRQQRRHCLLAGWAARAGLLPTLHFLPARGASGAGRPSPGSSAQTRTRADTLAAFSRWWVLGEFGGGG